MAILFLAQFLTVYLLGIQSLMVRDGNQLGAAGGSVLIGLSQFQLFGIVPVVYQQGLWSSDAAAFLLAGPLAIVASIRTHPRLAAWFQSVK
ncbi:hypothetical protein KUW19_00150 [Ferrimonas balearica]|uniref:hypothetical protein n=1 Tax=Ferrimonas balearica TaxID=44012 RepID=UPI001C93AB17|nr:hypothetical protein [Ferrimonas balearica]MBY6104892.1 hypothetical protein [Ferrimonas balearica]